MRTAEKNRREHARDDAILLSISKMIEVIDAETKIVEEEMSNHINQNPSLKKKVTILNSVPGIGVITAITLCCALPELGVLNRRQIASLVGLAPINCDSGQYRGKRMTGGGRRDVRTTLYMPTVASLRYSKVIGAYFQRLANAGKSKKVALVAAMRKIVTIMNSPMAKNMLWAPKNS